MLALRLLALTPLAKIRVWIMLSWSRPFLHHLRWGPPGGPAGGKATGRPRTPGSVTFRDEGMPWAAARRDSSAHVTVPEAASRTHMCLRVIVPDPPALGAGTAQCLGVRSRLGLDAIVPGPPRTADDQVRMR